MKTVFLLRHAKSDWADAGLKDQDRRLSERGRDAAPRMGAYLSAKHYEPDAVLCSTARRTVETCDLVKSAIGEGVQVQFEDSLYLAGLRHLLDRLKWLDDHVKSAMIIGHNPGLEQLANALPHSPKTEAEEKLHRRMREKFSTCALAVIKLPIKTWRDLKPGTGTLVDFMRPRDL
ncbi:MAG: histidine phosphatase family protein [Alphaproteobacteria bacterium]|nr:histidine phosphatase family protein [Alphaproteobacteria bacterium]